LAEEVSICLASPVRAGPRLARIGLLLRLTLRARRQTGVMKFVAHVAEGHAPGRRMARLAGMQPAPPTMAGFERWETV
jgi:hypothetical protein